MIFLNVTVLTSKIITAKDIFQGLDALLITHEHSDHFSAELTLRALNENKALQVISTQAVTGALRKAEKDEEIMSRVWTMHPNLNKSLHMNIRGVNIEACSMAHDSYENTASENLMFLFSLNGKTFLHVGDAKADSDAFGQLECLKRKIDVMFVPFTYVGTADGRKVISDLKPLKLVVVHLPDSNIDTNKWTEKAKLAYDKNAANLPPTVFFEKSGQQFTV